MIQETSTLRSVLQLVMLITLAFSNLADANESRTTVAAAAADSKIVSSLIAQLGSSQFSERERASKQLLSYGLEVFAPLQRAQNHTDRETRMRVRELLAELVLVDRELRISNFVASAPAVEQLPGWGLFSRVAGDTPASRRLMGAMLQDNWDILENADSDPAEAGSLLMQRCEELQRAMSIRRETVSNADVAALLLLAINPETGVYKNTQQQIYNFCYRIRVEPAPADLSAETDPLRKLLGAWVARPVDVSNTAFYSLNIALRFSLAEGLAPAIQILDENNAAPYIRQYAILTVARFKDHSSRQRLEAMLADQSVCYTQKNPRNKSVAFESQIRDVALAILVYLDGKSPSEFGFERMRTSTNMVFQPNTLGFTTDEKRRLAFDSYVKLRTASGHDIRPLFEPSADSVKSPIANPNS